MAWRMTTYLGGDQTVVAFFNTPEDWRAWLRSNYPDIINTPVEEFIVDGEETKQYGTNARWSSLGRVED